jgi:hypothetical protein
MRNPKKKAKAGQEQETIVKRKEQQKQAQQPLRPQAEYFCHKRRVQIPYEKELNFRTKSVNSYQKDVDFLVKFRGSEVK